ncbi:alkaline phosphatase [Gallaecimonas sp. GXIMD4217]|uniref:alkaline phosphatase n=1 Tax=Gallaecimonas sp. GXIMD4217 TaxID=3131927 RepID=UPI00311AE35A
MLRSLSLLAALCLSAQLQAAQAPKNIIFMIGDGMGPAYPAAYRYFADDPATPRVENTVFDEMLVGMATTYPDEPDTIVTDSAAAATALATGHKSYNGAIAVDRQKQPLATLLELAKQRGLSTGLAVTSQVNHATPAAFMAHNESRRNYDAIADAYLDERINGKPKADLLLGGGLKFFKREDRDLVAEFMALGYGFVDSAESLGKADRLPLLGLFGDVALPSAIDDQKGPRLAAMTAKAVTLLDDNPKGFFLLVEGSQIDWAGHDNDIVTALHEMADFAAAIRWARDYARENQDTLVVVTADHGTGGLTLGADGKYQWRADFLRQIPHSPRRAAKLLLAADEPRARLGGILGFAPSREEAEAVLDARDDGPDALARAIKTLIDKRSLTGWTTSGHTAIDVPVYAFGPGAETLGKVMDNTELSQRLLALMTAR